MTDELSAAAHRENVDVLVVAGDLCSSRMLEESLSKLEAIGLPIIYITGNHEHYGSSLGDIKALRKRIEPTAKNVHWLDCSTVEVNGQRFVGTTLWFPSSKTNWKYTHMLSDFGQIKRFGAEYAAENQRCVEFLRQEVRANDVVVTHHLPSLLSTPARFQQSPLNRFFVCDVTSIVEQQKPRLWIHGHTHDSCNYKIGVTDVICNPFGYAGHEVNPGFKPDLIVEI